MPDPSVLNKLLFDAPTVTKKISALMRAHPSSTFGGVEDLSPFHVALLTLLADNLFVCMHEDVMLTVYRGGEQFLGFSVFMGIQQGLIGIPTEDIHLAMKISSPSGVTSRYPVPASIKHLPFDWQCFKCLSVDAIVKEYERATGSNN